MATEIKAMIISRNITKEESNCEFLNKGLSDLKEFCICETPPVPDNTTPIIPNIHRYL